MAQIPRHRPGTQKTLGSWSFVLLMQRACSGPQLFFGTAVLLWFLTWQEARTQDVWGVPSFLSTELWASLGLGPHGASSSSADPRLPSCQARAGGQPRSPPLLPPPQPVPRHNSSSSFPQGNPRPCPLSMLGERCPAGHTRDRAGQSQALHPLLSHHTALVTSSPTWRCLLGGRNFPCGPLAAALEAGMTHPFRQTMRAQGASQCGGYGLS